jgi:hypothetical protein
VELEFWRSIKDSADHEEFQLYLERFSSGTYADLARRKMDKLQTAATQGTAQTDASVVQQAPAQQLSEIAEQPVRSDEAQSQSAAALRKADEAAVEAQKRVQSEAAVEAQRQAEWIQKEQRKATADAQTLPEKIAADAQKPAQKVDAEAEAEAQKQTKAGSAKSKTALFVGAAAVIAVLIGGAVSVLSGPSPAPVSEQASTGAVPAIAVPGAPGLVAPIADAATQQADEAKKLAGTAQADPARAAQKAQPATQENVARADQQAGDRASEIAAKKISDDARSKDVAAQKAREEAKARELASAQALAAQKAGDAAKARELASAQALAAQKAGDAAKARELASAQALAAQKAGDEAKARELASAQALAAQKARDEAKAQELASAAASAAAKAKTNPQALFEQAQRAEKEGRVREAVGLYKQAYGAGNGNAARMLGDIYARGSGDVGRDYSEQVQWYGKAKAMGVDVPVLNKRKF